MEDKVLVILGSARKDGCTRNFAEFILEGMEYSCIDLLDIKITPYNYEGDYPKDDRFELLASAIAAHSIIIVATPVYWYAMSGLLKTVFDRLTDLVTINKKAGRALKGKRVIVIATGTDDDLPEGFLVPFKNTAAYFEMEFNTAVYHNSFPLPVMTTN